MRTCLLSCPQRESNYWHVEGQGWGRGGTDGPLAEVNVIVLELRSGVGRPGFGFCLSVTLSLCLKLCEPRRPHLENDGHSDR